VINYPIDSRILPIALPTAEMGELLLCCTPGGNPRKLELAELRDYIVALSILNSRFERMGFSILNAEELLIMSDVLRGFNRCSFRWDSASGFYLEEGSYCVGDSNAIYEINDDVYVSAANLDTGALADEHLYNLWIGVDNQDEVQLVLSLSSDCPASLFSACPIGCFYVDNGGFVPFTFSGGVCSVDFGTLSQSCSSYLLELQNLPYQSALFPVLIDFSSSAALKVSLISCAAHQNYMLNSSLLSFLGDTIHIRSGAVTAIIYYTPKSWRFWQ
jgi:hypothetical protein